MTQTHPPSPCIVVGIDGSPSALTAALWAVEEAVDRHIPLRLVCAIEPPHAPTTSEDAAHALASAEMAVRRAFTAVEATDTLVKIEVEILQGRPADKLLKASHGAVMVCVGAIGLTSAPGGRVGSTAVEVATWAHCPVAIIRGFDPSPTQPTSVVVEVDSSSDGDVVLQRGIDEALLRHAPLVVISVGPPHPTDIHDGDTVTEQNHQAAKELDRRLTRATRQHPRLEVRPVAGGRAGLAPGRSSSGGRRAAPTRFAGWAARPRPLLAWRAAGTRSAVGGADSTRCLSLASTSRRRPSDALDHVLREDQGGMTIVRRGQAHGGGGTDRLEEAGTDRERR
jgi:nucleotide-binding universal stress UspA family protein